MDTPPKQTILFDNTVKLRAEFNEFKKEFDKISVAQNEFNIAQHKINNVILKYSHLFEGVILAPILHDSSR
jgi:hypothetical protein